MLEQHGGACGDFDGAVGVDNFGGEGISGVFSGVHDEFPPLAKAFVGQGEFDAFVVGVEAEDEGVVDDALAAAVGLGDGVAVEVHHEGFAKEEVPVGLGHEFAGGDQPRDVALLHVFAEGTAGKEAAASENGVVGADAQQTPGEFD